MSASKTATGGNSPKPTVRRLTDADRAAWLDLRQALWMGTDATTRAAEDGTLLSDPKKYGALRYEVLVAVQDGQGAGKIAGFVEVSLRDDMPEIAKRPIGYIEGVYVAPHARRRRIGYRLLREAEAWARAAGARELAAEVMDDNDDGLALHLAAGFMEVGETATHSGAQTLLCKQIK